MNLLITFLVSIAVAITGIAWLGVLIDRFTSPFISLLVFFPLFFVTIWLTWRLSVKFTEPKSTTSA